MPLRNRSYKSSVRRIYVKEQVIIPPDCSANVPVRMPFANLRTPDSDWVSEPKEVRPGLLAARTLLPHDDKYAAISLVNLSGVEQSLRVGHNLGAATSCSPKSVFPFTANDQAVDEMTVGSADVVTQQTVSADSDIACNQNSDVVDNAIKCATVHSVTLSDAPPVASSDDFSHIQPVIDKLPPTLTADQREQAIDLIKCNADVFSRHEFDVGCTNLLTAHVNTEDHRPIAEPLRRHARVHLDVIDETISKMKDAGIVEEANSPWSANLVIIARKDENGKPCTPRVTIDFRGLNAITYKDKYPIPNLQDCLRSLDRAEFMSVIDLSNSFYQIEVHPDDRDKLAFVTRRGQFRLTRLGQECTNSPAVFCL